MGLRRGTRDGPRPARQKDSASRAGLDARVLAHRLIAGVLIHRRPLDQVLAERHGESKVVALEARDRAFARALAATVLRRYGELDHILATFLPRPPRDDERIWPVLLAGAAQLLCLGTPPHAAVDLAVEAVRSEPGATRFAGLVNAVLRRIADKGCDALQGLDQAVELNVPAWMRARWATAYGADQASSIAKASLREAALDISLKAPASDASNWAERLGGRLLPTGSIRCIPQVRVEELPGYAEGAWWVQDAAAALVTRVAGPPVGKTVADLCAAPGGKTAALAATGATVTAVDISSKRLERLTANLHRLSLSAEIIAADAATWKPGRTFDIVVLDAPCTATGTIRRHPDILRLRQPADMVRMVKIQRALLVNASQLVRPGGTLIYSTCSLEPEEGEQQVETLLAGTPDFARVAMQASQLGADPSWISAAGDLRTLPCHLPLEPEQMSGLDGFYVARLERRA